MKTGRFSSALSMIVMTAAGIFLLLRPGDTVDIVVKVIGGIIALIGAMGVISWLLQKKKMLRDHMKLVVALIEVLAGVIVMANPTFIASIYPVIIGVVIALVGVGDFLASLEIKKKRGRNWVLAMILSLIAIVLGVIVMLNPFQAISTLVRIIGIVMIYTGVTGIIIAFA